MDERVVSGAVRGGSLEPLDRQAVLKAQLTLPAVAPGWHYELRDPFAEVTYRGRSYEEMVARAERLRAVRFVAIGADGKRITLAKQGRQWQRPDPDLVNPPSQAGQTRSDAAALAKSRSPDAPAGASQTEERAARTALLEARLSERYLIKRAPLRIGDVTIGQTEYWHRGDSSRLAFTESTFRVSTETTSPSIARSMIDLAEARHWRELRVSGNDEFRRLIWIEASLRDLKTVGYEPLPADHDALRKARQQQRERDDSVPANAEGRSDPAKQSARGGGGRKAVIAALEAVLVERGVPEPQRIRVLQAAVDNLARRTQRGELHRVKVYDPAAPTRRPPPARPREPQQSRERAAPVR